MYERFYEFTAPPFQLTPDSRFYFDSRAHARANAPGTSGFSQRSLSASATFSHQLTRSATVSAYFDYSTLDTPQGGALAGLGQSPVYTGALTGTYQTANRLEFDLQLAVTNTSLNGYGVSPGIACNGVQASITFGVQKVF